MSSTTNICICCSEEVTKSIILHKTRRQVHQLCYDCAEGYLSPIIKKMTHNIRRKHHIDKNNLSFKCSGTYHGEMRNRCEKNIHINCINFKVNDDFPLYTDILRIQTILNFPNTVICINENCGNVIETDPQSKIISCTECNLTWCAYCLTQPYHEGLSCLEYDLKNENTEDIKYIRTMKENGTLKFCPVCHVATIKEKNNEGTDIGCNKIICTSCGVKWCWLCRKQNIDYDHFNQNSKEPCSNKLWLGTIGGQPL
tara:strand:+ start:412 stop:1176 length:765 start_codon:yes stop_codon:yes gene_type:complete